MDWPRKERKRKEGKEMKSKQHGYNQKRSAREDTGNKKSSVTLVNIGKDVV